MRDAVLALAAVAALGLCVTASAASAEPSVEGFWRTPVHHAIIQVYACGPDEICGRVMDSDLLRTRPDLEDQHNPNPALRARRIHGLPMMWGFHGGPKDWKGGVLYNPDDGRTYHGDVTLEGPDTLRLKGCLIGPLCLSQTWTRAAN